MKPNISFIEAIQIITRNSEFELCTDESELSGIRPCVCVYKSGDFMGKLRWPKDGHPAEVDPDLEEELLKYRIQQFDYDALRKDIKIDLKNMGTHP